MTTPLDDTINDMLARWHVWSSAYRPGKGHAAQSSYAKDYRAGGHWDWQNGATDAKVEDIQMRGVDECIERLPDAPQRWRLSLKIEARNQATGYKVWHSAALPASKDERAVLLLEARNRFARLLLDAGLISR